MARKIDSHFLSGEQREVIGLPECGAFDVTGPAGCGKTLMAMKRAEYLCRQFPNRRVLLLTYNKFLASSIKLMMMEDESEDIFAETGRLEGINFWYRKKKMVGNDTEYECKLNSKYTFDNGSTLEVSHFNGHFSPSSLDIEICQNRKKMIKDAYEEKQFDDYGCCSLKDIPLEIVEREITFIETHGLFTFEDYLKSDRFKYVEDRVPFLDSIKRMIFDVYWRSRELRLNYEGYVGYWDDYLERYDSLDSDARERLFGSYHHIIIDEGQDFTFKMLDVCLDRLDPNFGGLTIFSDPCQRIYRTDDPIMEIQSVDGMGFDPFMFHSSYRLSKQLAAFADRIKNETWFKKTYAFDKEQVLSFKDGEKPELVLCKNRLDEIRTVAEDISGRIIESRCLILLPKNEDIGLFLKGLGEIGSDIIPKIKRIEKDTEISVDKTGVYIGTYHSAKGLGFDRVYLPFFNDSQVPEFKSERFLIPQKSKIRNNKGISDEAVRDNLIASIEQYVSDCMSMHVKQVYVAVTRAEVNLIITWNPQENIDGKVCRKLSRFFPKRYTGKMAERNPWVDYSSDDYRDRPVPDTSEPIPF